MTAVSFASMSEQHRCPVIVPQPERLCPGTGGDYFAAYRIFEMVG
jgi:hypothetical protein